MDTTVEHETDILTKQDNSSDMVLSAQPGHQESTSDTALVAIIVTACLLGCLLISAIVLIFYNTLRKHKKDENVQSSRSLPSFDRPSGTTFDVDGRLQIQGSSPGVPAETESHVSVGNRTVTTGLTGTSSSSPQPAPKPPVTRYRSRSIADPTLHLNNNWYLTDPRAVTTLPGERRGHTRRGSTGVTGFTSPGHHVNPVLGRSWAMDSLDRRDGYEIIDPAAFYSADLQGELFPQVHSQSQRSLAVNMPGNSSYYGRSQTIPHLPERQHTQQGHYPQHNYRQNPRRVSYLY